ncbi:MAG: hypothetical protein L0Y55_01010, partial [Anaerolineales bacterium]|nr:hypothetical protein [Anaerolineales bacterium]
MTNHPATRIYVVVALAVIAWCVAYTILQPLTEYLTFDILHFERGTHLGEAIAFFLYDVPKILLLLSAMIFIITIIRTFFSA